MPTPSKSAKKSSARKKGTVKVGDLKPTKDAKGGGRRNSGNSANNNRRTNIE